MKVDAVKLVRAVFLIKRNMDVDDELVEFVLWERTGWPIFWPRDVGRTPWEALEHQLWQEI